MSKLEPIVLDCLARSGFEVQRSKLAIGDVRLTITRPAERWQIVLKPRISPLIVPTYQKTRRTSQHSKTTS